MPSFESHPAASVLSRAFAKTETSFEPSALTRADYLTLIAANVDHWKQHQNEAGAIIDPVSKGERQYSTPAFALAAGLLASEANRKDVLEPAIRAMSFATHQLAIGKSADGHADFYTPMLIHARRVLKPLTPPEVVAKWDSDLRSIEPEKIYNMRLKGMNWNLVSSSGELLRRQDGLVRQEQMKPQWDYLEERLADHAKAFSQFGMYADPGVPMAYDAFARLWLDDVMANSAYDGMTAKSLSDFLTNGALSSLLLLSPTGEWPGGGRSSHHNWCEAEIIAICEMHARRWNGAGQPRIAGAFKRAAHLALTSMRRWQRPSGELNIIKNRFEPDKRFAYEGYSNHSQYNLLPMAMLAMAYQHADDSIAETPIPSESGSYVFDARETFHKVVAAGGGYYVLIDTAGDPHYNATGLQRVQRTGVPFSPLTDSATKDRGYGKNDGPSQTLVPGFQWRENVAQGEWKSLGDAFLADPKKPIGEQAGAVEKVDLAIDREDASGTSFNISWKVVGSPVQVLQHYQLSAKGVAVSEKLVGDVGPLRVILPVTVMDGIDESKVAMNGHSASVSLRGSILTWTVDARKPVELDPKRSPAHPGLLQPLFVELPAGQREVSWTIRLESDASTSSERK